MSVLDPLTLDLARRRLLGVLPGLFAEAPAKSMRRAGKPAAYEDDGEPGALPVAVTTPPALLRWLNRASFGATPALLAEVNALGGNDDARWQAWVEQQLNPGAINDPQVDARLTAASHPTLFKSLTELWTQHHAVTDNHGVRMRPISESECAKVVRAVYSRRQLFEVAVDFWHDHFSTFGWHYDGGTVFPHYDRDVIRVNALGNFRDMLGAVTRATTMMYYLDLRSNRRDGPNENYARELVELHTLGAENYAGVLRPDDPSLPLGQGNDGVNVRLKYVDEDVYSATRAFTGWTIRDGHWQFPTENDGTFTYRAGWHDNYSKWFLNRFIQSYKGEDDGELVLNALAAHPGTATHVCRKLCRRLVGDNPPESLVQSAAQVFGQHWQAPDQIARVLRHILLSSAFKNAFNQKMARPFSVAMAALRGLDADFTPTWDTENWTVTDEFTSNLRGTGHSPFYWPAPNGYPDKQEAWSSSGALAMTWKLLAHFTTMRHIRGDNQSPLVADVVAQTMAALPAAAQRTAAGIIDYWLGRLYGFQPEAARRTQLVNFLRQNAAADAPLDISTDAWANANNPSAFYTQSRLRYAVALILCAPDYFRR